MGEQLTKTYGITGMTCGHCVASVHEELTTVPDVTDVAIDLNVGGVSTVQVSSTRDLSQEEVSAAVKEAGYTLVAS
ncbi:MULTISPECIES: heavy-metal-associated domain-containing protein [unclassified Frigoribacterium]|jgi:copper chaperone CopZ|uniref:heavy-metal-associated domain-containing protein n=1 Tax=unclassified Frigoribacterium TaxID=2627005 RepID=UPI000F475F67|nr:MULTISPECIES: heavy-metal-associated domain-containing protein [unclassified Frigoribacterium]ROS48316.1 copper chaperone CopZ [Frigoribacterium sp. PhB118]ROS49692.1 copper chaperone CopZ [Frigoribacterium sp. PhB24]TWX38409.1 heavy-metal-associated domain-containing protein [Frigoribacterium sp. ACAM 257]